jgi:hypothetical protein
MVLDYPAGKYRFGPVTAALLGVPGALLGVPGLAALHEHYPAAAGISDQDTAVHRRFYDGFAGCLAGIYAAFLREQIAPLWDEPLVVQRVPTFRVAMPESTAVSEYHTDGDYRHQQGTVNFWVPLTAARDTSAIWLESAPGRGDFAPANLRPGQMLRFDGVNLRHGNEKNSTGQTRVSFDFRVIPASGFRDSGALTVTAGVPLSLGAYFGLLRDGRWEQ